MGRSKVAGKILARGRPPVEMAILSMVSKWLVLWCCKGWVWVPAVQDKCTEGCVVVFALSQVFWSRVFCY